ncbi:MAG: alpha/beta hydrolase-fold protein [Saprospiraceae bacterium]
MISARLFSDIGKHLLLFITVIRSLDLPAQPSKSSSNDLTITIDSKILKEKLNAFVSLPEGYHKTTAAYPVVYVLDGESFFTLTSNAAITLIKDKTIPPCIIIGIKSLDRQRDFTTPVDKNADQDNEINISGGADRFLDYLEKELIPTISNKYRTQPYRVIIGHSMGGLLVYHALYSKPELFQAHISIDGSLWWNKGSVGKSFIHYLGEHPQFKGKLFECRKDISQPVRFPVNMELLQYLEKNRPVRLQYKYVELKNVNHATVVAPGIYGGLAFVF